MAYNFNLNQLEEWVKTHPYFHNHNEKDVKVFAVTLANGNYIDTEYYVPLDDKFFGFGKNVIRYIYNVYFTVGNYKGIAYPNKWLKNGKIKVDLIQ